MSESHILLLPRNDYFKWVKAAQRYALAFGVSITPEPEKAGSNAVITVVITPNGYPKEGDIERYLLARYPKIVIDPIQVDSPGAFEEILNQRVESGEQFGQTRGDPEQKAIPKYSAERLYLFWPTESPVITQAFGVNPEMFSISGLPGHEGIDFRAPYHSSVFACAPGEVYMVEHNPDAHAYGKHVRIRHAHGYRTVYAHLSELQVQVGEKVSAKQVIGRVGLTGNSGGAIIHLTLKKDHTSENGETDFPGDVIDPTPFLVFPHQEAEVLEALNMENLIGDLDYPWASPCLIGVNSRPDGTLQEPDFSVLTSARIEAIKVMQNTSVGIVNQLRHMFSGIFIMARLAPPLGQMMTKPIDWVSGIREDMLRLYSANTRYFEIHQSPNLHLHGWGQTWHSGKEFGDWWLEVAMQLREEFPESRLGFPGVSPGEYVPEQRSDALSFLDQADAAIQKADWVGVNCYWASEQEMYHPDKGRFYLNIRQRHPEKLIFITEFANVNQFTDPSVKGLEYVKYYLQIRGEKGIGAAFAQVISAGDGYNSLVWRKEDGALTEIPGSVGERSE